MYILMALEAARQLRNIAGAYASFLQLASLLFHEPFFLDVFTTPDSTLEVQFTSMKMDSTDQYQFEIFSQSSDKTSNWTKHCSGIFGWIDHDRHTSNSAPCNTYHSSDSWDKWLGLGHPLAPELTVSRMSPQGSAGYFDALTEDFENLSISPTTLNSIFYLPPISLLGHNLPAEYRLISIGSVSVPIDARSTNRGNFAIAVDQIDPQGVEANIEIRQGDLHMFFNRLKYEVDSLLAINPARSSLFFTPRLLPDISKLSSIELQTVSDCMMLLTHKWPMSDIRVIGVSAAAIGNIVDSLHAGQPGTRCRFESLQILGKSAGSSRIPDHVQYVGSFSPGSKVHMIFSSAQLNSGEIQKQLKPNGLACVCGMVTLEMESFSESFEKVARITGLDLEEWSLWRMKHNEPPAHTGRRTIVFSSSGWDEASALDLPNAEYIQLQHSAIEGFSNRSGSSGYDAIIVDSMEKSVITFWHGHDLLPWLQSLLNSADSILWVTKQSACHPFNELAGSLLRTMQSERPSLKVTWLVFKNIEEESMQSIRKCILLAYESMLMGENEVKLEVEDSQIKILRYLPDDELSAASGLILPQLVESPLGDQDYSLSLAASQEPVILSSYPDPLGQLEEGLVSIIVEASVIDINDILAFRGASGAGIASSGFGMFFAGRKESDCDNETSLQVVGWHSSSHRKHLEVPMKQIYEHGSEPAIASAEFAAIATASCITEGLARIREGDTFSLNVVGLLREALEDLCTQRGAKLLGPTAGPMADFVISLDPLRGLLVNNTPADVPKYLGSSRGRDAVALAWMSHSRFKSPVHIFNLSDHKKALETAALNPYSTVLTHTNIDKIIKHSPIHKEPKTLFSPVGAYILVGGLGGLGRFVCRWLTYYGAKHVISISRSGINSPEAQETYNSTNDPPSGTSLDVIKADATDRPAIAAILQRIRQKQPIKGVINMAMVLGDAPLASMTGEEWDRALSVKIDSSWILHEETLQDDLQFFILFSSIASVLGNRNQANYNVANTFLNALAAYRHSLRLPAVSIALGAMVDIGVLHDLNNPALLPTLTRSGLTHLDVTHLAKILEAAVQESKRFERGLVVTGLEMFVRMDGRIEGRSDPLHWTEVPEFGHLSTYKRSNAGRGAGKERSLRERIGALEGEEEKQELLTETFRTFLSGLLGFPESTFGDTNKLAMYGLDSLSAVSCQYWLFRGMYLHKVSFSSSMK